jgi:hypothetical protein
MYATTSSGISVIPDNTLTWPNESRTLGARTETTGIFA